ncbi:NAD-dependent protein deacylase [Paenibacillus sp. GCM10012307]|uniref:NAD-dependent protein deacetylase n=1 Tax=Paenibacillus roseus TaxID=2798579 RepID=A0A934MS79_9BACL|nr:NAD-dependent protein deacylase [Paenibacillus roseus]MBJ6363024.1 NAD-dependent protein deacylase [Paenibacillus roseus]
MHGNSNFYELKQLVEQSERIVFFGGAGTSTESGIPDFRSAEGLFNNRENRKLAPEEMLSRDFFIAHPEDFYLFYTSKMIYTEAKPNKAHLALAELERDGKLKAVITQNIDGLHQLAGSRNVLELHGSVHRNYCMDCGESYPLSAVVEARGAVPRCSICNGIIKPDVVLYQESLDMEVLERAAMHISKADMLIVAGTSLTVQPAAGLVRLYKGDRLVLINKSATPMDRLAKILVQDSIGKVLDAIIR